jgi:uncharacterized membrane protein
VHTMETPATESIAGRSKEVARIAAFSDGVFAIAITLLTLQLAIPRSGELTQDLSELQPNFFAFVISFLVIGNYWVAHHRLFAVVVRYDNRLIWLNLLTLFFIVLLPFTTSVIAEYGSQPLGVILYASSLAGAGFANTALAAYVLIGHRMCQASTSSAEAGFSLWRGAAVAIYFVASLLLLLLPAGTENVMFSWLGIPVVEQLVRRHYRTG